MERLDQTMERLGTREIETMEDVKEVVRDLSIGMKQLLLFQRDKMMKEIIDMQKVTQSLLQRFVSYIHPYILYMLSHNSLEQTAAIIRHNRHQGRRQIGTTKTCHLLSYSRKPNTTWKLLFKKELLIRLLTRYAMKINISPLQKYCSLNY